MDSRSDRPIWPGDIDRRLRAVRRIAVVSMNPIRSQLIVLQTPAFKIGECPSEVCHWCGYLMEFEPEATWHNRQRRRHRGDRLERPIWVWGGDTAPTSKSPVKRDCNREFKLSMVWSGQNACRWRAWKSFSVQNGDQRSHPNGYEIHCVDCNRLCETGFVRVNAKRLGFNTRRKVLRPWEADHKAELQDHGEHKLDNHLEPRCRPCHLEKTERERQARAQLDQELKPILEALQTK